MTDPGKQCGHGFAYTVECVECDLVWEREMLANARKAVAYHEARLNVLRGKQQWADEPEISTPMVDALIKGLWGVSSPALTEEGFERYRTALTAALRAARGQP